MTRPTLYLTRLTLAALLATALLPASARAACVIITPLNQPATVSCTPIPPLDLDTRTIDTGAYKSRGTWLATDRANRAESWPLGDPAVQNCRFCLEPDRQNAARLKALQ
ncbi:MAG: hypothetical protein VX871_04190 [Pseudomonadota bacterium]|nr:hypothetical protein [Pseudomonadota bacterium]